MFAGVPIFIILSWIFIKYIFNPDERNESEYPEIKQLINDGWEQGSEPYLKGDDYERKDE